MHSQPSSPTGTRSVPLNGPGGNKKRHHVYITSDMLSRRYPRKWNCITGNGVYYLNIWRIFLNREVVYVLFFRQVCSYLTRSDFTVNMAAPTGPGGTSGSSPPGFEGFPFPVSDRSPGGSSGKAQEQEQVGGVKKKPCRVCTDFKSWMKLQKKQTTTAAQVTGGHWRSTCSFVDMLRSFWMMLFQMTDDIIASTIKTFTTNAPR